MKRDNGISFAFVGGLLTLLYLIFIAGSIFWFWPSFAKMSPNEWGDFFAGTIGPVTLIWVVLGFFLQGRELKHSVDALQLQAEELKNSVEQQKQMVKVTEKQLRLDMEVRDKVSKRAISLEMPFFQIARGAKSISGDELEFGYRMKNLAGAAVSGTIKVNADFDVQLSEKSFQYLAKEQVFDFRVSTREPDFVELGKSYELCVESKNIHGATKIQKFNMKAVVPEPSD